jgi:hypothetical protein
MQQLLFRFLKVPVNCILEQTCFLFFDPKGNEDAVDIQYLFYDLALSCRLLAYSRISFN